MGRSLAEVGRDGTLTATTEATGFSLYDGSAGIALFLARLFEMTGLAEARTTALGAIERSIRQLERVPVKPALAMSVFVGTLGVAYAARQVAGLVGDAALTERSESLLESICRALSKSDPLDVLGGKAGAIPVLLELSRQPGLSGLQAVAVELGEQIVGRARRTESIWSWAPDPTAETVTPGLPLTGLSHGASGIAWSLLELHAATGRREYREAANGAFAYEDSLFDPKLGNWPDLRDRTGPESLSIPLRYVCGWCHGAPGIALARLRAATLDPMGRPAHLAMARAAVATTGDTLETTGLDPSTDASLCHGVAGWIDVVWIAGRLLGDATYRERAERAAQHLLQSKPASGHWPSGVASRGPNQSLMLGQAGVGYLCLRLHNPSTVPSVLLPGASWHESVGTPEGTT
jgi:lantibiotic modifying enzyme